MAVAKQGTKRKRKPVRKNGKIDLLKAMPKSVNDPINYWVDFWELQCFFSKDRLYSIDDFLGCIEKDHIGNELDIETGYDGDDILANYPEIGRNAFDLVLHRKYLFGNNYPFLVKEELRTIAIRSTLKENHKLYISLLLSSNMALIRLRKHHEWTAKFELFCMEKFKSLLSSSSKILNCGVGNIKRKSIHSNLIKENFYFVAKKTKIRMTHEFDKMPKNRRGDLGIDLIGYTSSLKKDMGDRDGSLAFAQCACGRNWMSKQRDVLIDVLRKFFQFRSPVLSVVFIPHSFRNSQGTWEKAEEIEHVIIVDRLRFFPRAGNDHSKRLFKKYYSSLFNQILKLDVEV